MGLGMSGKLWSTLILVATIENHILNMTKVTSFPRTQLQLLFGGGLG